MNITNSTPSHFHILYLKILPSLGMESTPMLIIDNLGDSSSCTNPILVRIDIGMDKPSIR